jgi:pilus assembly protein CpaF
MFKHPNLRNLAALISETGITDLVCNGFQHTQALQSGKWIAVANPYQDESQLAEAARELIAEGGRQLDQAHPFANVTLHSRVRVHALLASAINPNTHLSVRVHGERPFALQQLAQLRMLTVEDFRLLQEIISTKESFLISGSSGSGKTTLLRAMLLQVPEERIIAIEDVAELNIQNSSFVSLQTRSANIEGRGEITLQNLLTESLRMRPDRIVVGEVRGAELVTLLQAINTGHASAATIHANSVTEVSKRLLAIAQSSGMTEATLNSLVRASLDWLIHIECSGSSRRVIIRRVNS